MKERGWPSRVFDSSTYQKATTSNYVLLDIKFKWHIFFPLLSLITSETFKCLALYIIILNILYALLHKVNEALNCNEKVLVVRSRVTLRRKVAQHPARARCKQRSLCFQTPPQIFRFAVFHGISFTQRMGKWTCLLFWKFLESRTFLRAWLNFPRQWIHRRCEASSLPFITTPRKLSYDIFCSSYWTLSEKCVSSELLRACTKRPRIKHIKYLYHTHTHELRVRLCDLHVV